MTVDEIRALRDKATAAVQAVLWVAMELFVLAFVVHTLWEWARGWTW